MSAKNTPEKFWALVKKSKTCWEFMGPRSWHGYGSFRMGKTTAAHRNAWILEKGPIPKGLLVCHKCDNPPCVRPDHLFLGTHSDNNQDAFNKGRKKPNRYVTNQLGVKNINAKLNKEKVHKIRALFASGLTQTEIAPMFGVSQPLIGCVVRRAIWKHV